jgi:Ca2+-binding EF-hand superfamily protein
MCWNRIVIVLLIGTFSASGPAQAQAPKADAFIQKWDTDHDGTLSRDEVIKAASARFDALDRKRKRVLTRSQLAGMFSFQQFRRADKDKDGTIDKAEFLSVADKLFRSADKDHDGTLDKKELRSSPGKALRRLFAPRQAPIF